MTASFPHSLIGTLHTLAPTQSNAPVYRTTVVNTPGVLVQCSKSNTAAMNEAEDRFPSDPDLAIEVGIVIPSRHNGRRALSTRLAPCYYACYIYRVDVHQEVVKVHIEALGEWDLVSPQQSLFCLLVGKRETWEDVAHAARQDPAAAHRFVQARWVPRQESQGYHAGSLILPLSVFDAEQTASEMDCRLAFRFGASVPWRGDFPTVHLVQFSTDELPTCPRTKAFVPPTDPWRPVFPREVEERFRTRELLRDSTS